MKPGETLPLTMKNSDNKIIASACLRTMHGPCQAYTVDIQRGFAPARQFLQIALDSDCQARVDGMPSQGSLSPMLMFWDITAAFRACAVTGFGRLSKRWQSR